MDEYPKFMCRAGNVEEAWGRMIEPGRAETPEEEQAMVDAGWVYRPDEIEDEAAQAADETLQRRRGRPPKAQPDEGASA